MSAFQSKINFRAKKSSFIVKNEKENLFTSTSPSKLNDVCKSPLKVRSDNEQESPIKSPKRKLAFSDEASPLKQKYDNSSPSQLIRNITLSSSKKVGKECFPKRGKSPVKKELFPITSELKLRYARRALHSSNPKFLPGREDKIEKILEILKESIKECKPHSIYISGPPGTGKTASLNSIVSLEEIKVNYKMVYINCTCLNSSKSLYPHIAKELGLSFKGKSEKCLQEIKKYWKKCKKMTLLILDEVDQLDRTELYALLECASGDHRLVLVGVANSLDLTQRLLPRLASHAHLVPTLLHFAPYSRTQLSDIIAHRLKEAECEELFDKDSLKFLSSKIAAVSGDVRTALDSARRMIQCIEKESLQGTQKISIALVSDILTKVYSTCQSLSSESTDQFPLLQKLVICSVMLIRLKSKTKEITVSKLHEVYKRVCAKRNLSSLDMSEFLPLLQLVEDHGIIKLHGKTKNRLSKITLQWDEKEVSAALKDKQLLSSILDDVSCLQK